MKYFRHFFKSNFKYNKLELGISYGLACAVFILYFVLERKFSKTLDPQLFISLGFYALLYAFFSNKKKFNLKYLSSLPLSKSRLLLVKACSDIVFFAPAMALAFFGVWKSHSQIAAGALFALLLQASLMASFYLFDGDVEQPRLENTRSSFVNRLVYVRKMVDLGFMTAGAAIIGVFVFALPVPNVLKQYILVLSGVFVLAFKYGKSLKLIQDESLSYFIFKRDAPRMAGKVCLMLGPVLALAIFKGGALKASGLVGKDPVKETALTAAVKRCDNEKTHSLLKGGADPDQANEAGETPLIVSVKKGCDASTALLLEFRASTEAKDDQGKTALEHMKSYESMYYYVKSKTPREYWKTRRPASEKR